MKRDKKSPEPKVADGVETFGGDYHRLESHFRPRNRRRRHEPLIKSESQTSQHGDPLPEAKVRDLSAPTVVIASVVEQNRVHAANALQAGGGATTRTSQAR
jgi:hypothetical protein